MLVPQKISAVSAIGCGEMVPVIFAGAPLCTRGMPESLFSEMMTFPYLIDILMGAVIQIKKTHVLQ